MRQNRFLASMLIGALVLFLVPTVARAGDVQSLLAKHDAFVGWHFGDGSVRSLSLQRRILDKNGAVVQTATESRIALAYRLDYTADEVGNGGSTGFTGNVFWTTSDNGFTVPLIGDRAKALLITDALFSEGATQLPATLQGDGNINGKPVQILRLTMTGAFAVDVYEDAATGAFLRAVIDPGGNNEETINILSYTALDSKKKMIGSWSYGTSTNTYSYTKAQLNALVSAAQLHPPSAAASWAFASAKPFPIKVTPDRVYLNATVNGVPGRFIIDTGASNIVLTDKFAERAKLKVVNHSYTNGIGGDAKTLVRRADAIVIGGNTLSNAIVTSINQNLDDKNYNETVDGLLGFDLFGGAIINLKLSDHTMSIGDPATVAVDRTAGFNVVPDLSDLTPHVSVRIADKIDALALLDSGGNDLVIVSSDIEKHGILLVADREHTFLGGNATIGGVGGNESVLCGLLSGISVGPIHYQSLTACESAHTDLHSALIGFDFMKNFDYVFDYPHGMMIVTPIKQ